MFTQKTAHFTTVFYLLSVVVLMSVIVTNSMATNPSQQTLTIGDTSSSDDEAPHFYGYMDAAGYSDVIMWGYEPNHHPHSYHEVLSGEWGAAIFYNGIQTEPNAMWLTDYFCYPYWTTNSNFQILTSPSAWHDQTNPVPLNNTGQSVIANDEVQITLDYEVVDLNEVVGLGDDSWSPMSIKDANSQIGFVKCFRYLFLQTYTIKNISDSDTTGLEFYQMLHSHGADEYGPCVHASYTPANYGDPLADYTPWNPVHEVGNFHYDFTQWNNLDEAETADHVDWVGFSSTIAPQRAFIGERTAADWIVMKCAIS